MASSRPGSDFEVMRGTEQSSVSYLPRLSQRSGTLEDSNKSSTASDAYLRLES
jgi:hypothetical protein